MLRIKDGVADSYHESHYRAGCHGHGHVHVHGDTSRKKMECGVWLVVLADKEVTGDYRGSVLESLWCVSGARFEEPTKTIHE